MFWRGLWSSMRRAGKVPVKGEALQDSVGPASLGFLSSHENVCMRGSTPEGEIVAACWEIEEGLVVLDKKPKPQDRGERRAELLRTYRRVITKSASQVLTADHAAVGPFRKKVRVADLAEIKEVEKAIRQQEREQFRSSIAAIEKSVEISGSSDFYPLLVSAFGKETALYGGYSFCRGEFEVETGLMLIPETDEDEMGLMSIPEYDMDLMLIPEYRKTCLVWISETDEDETMLSCYGGWLEL